MRSVVEGSSDSWTTWRCGITQDIPRRRRRPPSVRSHRPYPTAAHPYRQETVHRTSSNRDVNGTIVLLSAPRSSCVLDQRSSAWPGKNQTHLGRQTGSADSSKHRRALRATPKMYVEQCLLRSSLLLHLRPSGAMSGVKSAAATASHEP